MQDNLGLTICSILGPIFATAADRITATKNAKQLRLYFDKLYIRIGPSLSRKNKSDQPLISVTGTLKLDRFI